MQQIKIDFDNPGFPQRLDVVENDSQSRFFKAVLYKDGKAYTAPSGATYSIMYRGFGPQNEGWYDTINDGAGKRAACSVSGNVVTCEIARQALRVPGHVSVVLCVTGSNGYMLHGWPIDCNCRNDSYTSGTSVESFFYITQVTNADWTSAIQTWEELKNMIDPTLSLSGKAADAKATGLRYEYTCLLNPSASFDFDSIIKKTTVTAINAWTRVENAPFEDWKDGSTWFVENYYDTTTNNPYITQFVHKSGSNVYKTAGRTYDAAGGKWTSWSITSGIHFISLLTQKTPFDFNVVYKDNRITAINTLTQVTNAPFEDWKDGSTWFVENYYDANASPSYITQFVHKPSSNIYSSAGRTYDVAGGKWTDWSISSMPSNPTTGETIVCGSGKYKTLRSACEYAITKANTTVIVNPGTYDLASEYAEVIASQSGTGINLTNGIKLIFLAGSYVKAIFDNTSRWVYENFEPFHASGDFTLDGLNIEAANCRYCVHDEHFGNGTYHNKYINCVMKYTNTHTDVTFVQCIGGGLGEHGFIEIRGGVYTSVTTAASSGQTIDELTLPITYHNGNNANADSKIVIRDVYLTGKGRFRFGDYGPSTQKTKVLITGCRMGGETIHRYENSEFSVTNFEIVEWNNVIE